MKNTKKIGIILIVSLILTAFAPNQLLYGTPLIAEAHSGRTDSSGGHKDNKNASGLGYYHYHCGGYPAHLHTNGVCPYSSSGAGSSDGSTSVKKAKINKKSASLVIGKTVQLKVKNASGKVTWKSNNRKIANVSQKGKVTAKNAGKATITAKVDGKSLKCKVTVKRQYPTIKTIKWNFHGNNINLRIKNPTKKPIVIYPESKFYDDDYTYFASMFLNNKKSVTIPAGKTVTILFSGNNDNLRVTDCIEEYYDNMGILDYDIFDYKQEAYKDGIVWFTQRFSFSLLVNGEKIKCRAEYTGSLPYKFTFKKQ